MNGIRYGPIETVIVLDMPLEMAASQSETSKPVVFATASSLPDGEI